MIFLGIDFINYKTYLFDIKKINSQLKNIFFELKTKYYANKIYQIKLNHIKYER